MRWALTLDRREFVRGIAGAGLSVALAPAASLAGTPRRGGHLMVGLTGGQTTDSLDPALANAQLMTDTLKQFGEGLVISAANGRELEPLLAESWDHSDDLRTWNFKLRKGVTFHNGKTLSARDVVFSLNRHRGLGSKSGAVSSLKSVVDIRIDNANEITIALNEPNVEFPYLLTDYHLVIQPEGDRGDSGIGTGSYVIQHFRHGVRYVSARYPNYWRGDVGFVDSIETLVINDNSARVSGLLDGQLHLINRIEPKVARFVSQSTAARVVPTAGRGHYVFVMRCDAPPFDNADLRRALKLAIDREAMVRQILRGFGSSGNDSPINMIYPLACALPQHHYDPEQAAHFYKRSGHSGAIVLHTSEVAFAGAVDAAVLYKEQAAKAGIEIEVRRDPSDGYWDNIWNKVPFCATYWDGRPTQDQMLSLVYRSDAAWNETAWHRPAFDELLQQARREPQEAIRSEQYRRASSLIHDDGGAIIPMFSHFLDGVSNKVRGFVADVNNELSNGRFCERCWLA